MKKRTITLTLLVIAFLLLPLVTNSQPAKKASTYPSFSWVTGSIGGSIYVMTVGMADLIKKRTGIDLSVEALGGSDASIRAMRNKKVEIGMDSATNVGNAYLGIKQFAKEGRLSLRLLLTGQESLRHIVVRNDSGIKTPADLRGKKFMSILPGQIDLELLTDALLKAYGISKDEVKLMKFAETNESIEALKLSHVDGTIIRGGIGASNMFELAQTIPVTILSIPDDKMEIMLKDLGSAYHVVTLPAKTYRGQNQDVKCLSIPQVIEVMADFPEEVAYLITKTLLDNPQEIAAIHSVGKEWNIQNTLNSPCAPYHPGAIRYFKEKGLWSAAKEKEQENLLKK